jgi:hypothetical protein
MFFAAPK